MTINLTHTELFQFFTEIEVNDVFVNLHNDYECNSINYAEAQLTLSFTASSLENKIQQAELIFKNVKIETLNFDMMQLDDCKTIDTLYRGRFREG